MKRRSLLKSTLLPMIAMTVLAAVLGGCAGGKTADSSSRITIGIPQDIDSLDPHLMTAAGTKEVMFNVFEGLVKPDASGDLVPAVASEWTVSEDAMRYTFTLRDGIRFHDGSAVTVGDINYSILRAQGTGIVPALSEIAVVNTPDDKHVEIVLNQPDSDFLCNLTCAVIPEKNTSPETTPVGTGPYKFVSRSPQENIIVTRFDDYWGEPAGIKDVTFKIEANADAIVMDLEGGSVDMFARITSAQRDQLSDKFEVYTGTMNLVQALYLNNAFGPFADVRVRQALSYLLDRQGVMNFVSDGEGAALGSSMYPAFTKYFLPELNDLYPTDVDKAKALLKEAGYDEAHPLEFSITVASNYQQHVDTAQVLAEQFAVSGVVKASINTVEWNTWLSETYKARNYEATVVGVDASTLSATALLSRFQSDADNNFVNYSSPEYDKAYQEAMSAVDDAAKTEAYKKCERILAQDAASVYIQDLPCFVALNKKYTGYQFYPLYVQDVAALKPAE
ncbi:MAG: ABC transporter substrate-binding protein [Lachnospiraceae bacterium]|nr:ABC transporter substrate-binding protein [Lachnospiraceae bacterium]